MNGERIKIGPYGSAPYGSAAFGVTAIPDPPTFDLFDTVVVSELLLDYLNTVLNEYRKILASNLKAKS